MRSRAVRFGAPLAGALWIAGMVLFTVSETPGRTQEDAPGSVPVTRIEAGTPPEFLVPRVQGYTPVEIRKDGTQVYIVPVLLKNPDGTTRVENGRLEASPAPVDAGLPILLSR